MGGVVVSYGEYPVLVKQRHRWRVTRAVDGWRWEAWHLFERTTGTCETEPDALRAAEHFLDSAHSYTL